MAILRHQTITHSPGTTGRPLLRRCSLLSLLLVIGGCAASYTGYEADNAEPLSEKEMTAGLNALLTPSDFQQLQNLPDSQKVEWLRMFWQDHDPTPTTSDNEFRREHYRRVRYALYYFSNPFGSIPWDDRGEVYVRYGEPNERTYVLDGVWDRRTGLGVTGSRLETLSSTPLEQGGGGASSEGVGSTQLTTRDAFADYGTKEIAGEVWHYYHFGLSFQFQDEEGLGIYSLVPLIDDVGPSEEYSEFIQTRITAIDLQPAVYFHDYGGTRLDYALDLARFRSDGKMFNVDVNLGYPLTELARGGPDSNTISIRRSVVIRDDSLRDIASELSVLSRRVGPADGAQRLMVEQKVFNLPPGSYELSVSIEDLFSDTKGIYKKRFRLPEFAARDVQEISDIEMASFVWSVYEPGSPYVKANRLVMPLPSRVYTVNQPIAFYYEVYNLAKNDQDTAVYRVDYEIMDPQAKHVFFKEDAGRYRSADRDIAQFGVLEDPRLKPGEYLLSVNIKDEITRKNKRTLRRFKIVSAAVSPDSDGK